MGFYDFMSLREQEEEMSNYSPSAICSEYYPCCSRCPAREYTSEDYWSYCKYGFDG